MEKSIKKCHVNRVQWGNVRLLSNHGDETNELTSLIPTPVVDKRF